MIASAAMSTIEARRNSDSRSASCAARCSAMSRPCGKPPSGACVILWKNGRSPQALQRSGFSRARSGPSRHPAGHVANRCDNTYIVVMPNLRDELKQQKPFRSLQEEASLSVVRTSAQLVDTFERLLKPYGITGTQYNVLRILRGSEPNGLCRNEIRDRMVTRMPDVTRLLDRMEDADLIVRARVDDDRRMVRTRITVKGRRLVDQLDDVVAREHQRVFAALGRDEVRTLIGHLSALRERI